MHELSICQSMMRIVDKAMEDHPGAKLERIYVDVGMGSTVEPFLLKEAYAIATCGSAYEGSELVINEIPLVGRCLSCDRPFEYRELALGCPGCGSTNVKIESGLELSVRELEIEEQGRPQDEALPEVTDRR